MSKSSLALHIDRLGHSLFPDSLSSTPVDKESALAGIPDSRGMSLFDARSGASSGIWTKVRVRESKLTHSLLRRVVEWARLILKLFYNSSTT